MNRGCELYAEALVELASGDLDSGRVARVRAHVDTCEDCRAALDVIRAVRGAPAPIPEGLQDRVRAAVRGAAAESAAAPTGTPARSAPWARWRLWTLPAVAAAVLVLWIGGKDAVSPRPTDVTPEVETAAEYDPYGRWPGSDGTVAGDVVLSELSVEELEVLLEEMQS